MAGGVLLAKLMTLVAALAAGGAAGSLLSRVRNPQQYVPDAELQLIKSLDDETYEELMEEIPVLRQMFRSSARPAGGRSNTSALPYLYKKSGAGTGRPRLPGRTPAAPRPSPGGATHRTHWPPRRQLESGAPAHAEKEASGAGTADDFAEASAARGGAGDQSESTGIENGVGGAEDDDPSKGMANGYEEPETPPTTPTTAMTTTTRTTRTTSTTSTQRTPVEGDDWYLSYPYVTSCYWCGLNESLLPASTLCHDAFAEREAAARGAARTLRAQCYFHAAERGVQQRAHLAYPPRARALRHDRGLKLRVFGPYMRGCFKRFVDVGPLYTARGCRGAYLPQRAYARNFAAHRLARLELVARGHDDVCVHSPYASLTPFGRAVSLYVRYHVCVCSRPYCNAAPRRAPRPAPHHAPHPALVCSAVLYFRII